MTKLIWHIDRAHFHFEEPQEYTKWKENKVVRFEFSPSQADDPGESLFEDAFDIEIDQEVKEPESTVNIMDDENGPVISAWVTVEVETTDEFSEDGLSEWANEEGGWASASIYLGEYDAQITEDDGGDWRVQ